MKNTIVVVTDLGVFKTYKLDHTPIKQTPRLELIEELETVDAHGKMLDKVTDQAGRWRIPTTRMGMSYGERQKIDLETRRRLIKQLAEYLEHSLGRRGVEACYLAASKEILHQLMEALSGEARGKIVKSVPADLTKIEKSEVLEHFAEVAA